MIVQEAAALVMLSQGQMDRVLELLLTQGHVSRAGLLLEALAEIRHPVDNILFTDKVQTFFPVF